MRKYHYYSTAPNSAPETAIIGSCIPFKLILKIPGKVPNNRHIDVVRQPPDDLIETFENYVENLHDFNLILLKLHTCTI